MMPEPPCENSGMPPSNDALRALDLAHVWHPCTQMKDHEREMPLVPLRSGRGAWLEDFDGRRYLDAISSWWVNLWGHAHPRINEAVKAQLDALPHTMFAGFTHEPAARLAAELTTLHQTRRLRVHGFNGRGSRSNCKRRGRENELAHRLLLWS